MSGRIVVKVINHPGDEVMKVFRVSKRSFGATLYRSARRSFFEGV